MMPKLIISSEDNAEYSKIKGDIDSFVAEKFVRFVTGSDSLDSFETDYLAVLKEMGVDRMIEIQQKALDAYNNK